MNWLAVLFWALTVLFLVFWYDVLRRTGAWSRADLPRRVACLSALLWFQFVMSYAYLIVKEPAEIMRLLVIRFPIVVAIALVNSAASAVLITELIRVVLPSRFFSTNRRHWTVVITLWAGLFVVQTLGSIIGRRSVVFPALRGARP